MSTISKTLFTRLGGVSTLEKVHKTFYDKAYAHPWLSLYFTDNPQKNLEQQQTDFMTRLFGGPTVYCGRTPKLAHQHMLITDELFDLRQKLLSESIQEHGLSDMLREEWLAADDSLRQAIVKRSLSECKKAYNNQEILDFKKQG